MILIRYLVSTATSLRYRRTSSRMDPSQLWVVLLFLLQQVWRTAGVLASFNLFMDRHEAQKLLGLPSDIFYVREGVVNEYALNFTVKVPADMDRLRFSWQSFSKRPVQYELMIDYTNFFALLPPTPNITTTGRVPHKLESFLIALPCSGRINAEVAVNIRFKFHVKQHIKGTSSNNHTTSKGGNGTTINLMRNKICLLQEFIPTLEEPAVIGTKPPTPASPYLQAGNGGGSSSRGSKGSSSGSSSSITKGSGGSSPAVVSNSTLLLFQDPTPSLLLAGLLGGCAVTASIVFLIFFICLRRKLVPSSSSPLSSAYSGGGIINSDPNSSSNNSSPACLLRQSGVVGGGGGGGDSKWTTKESCCDSSTFKDKYSTNPTSTIGSRNSYVTIASFWNDIFGTHGNSHHSSSPASLSATAQHGPHNMHQQQQQQLRGVSTNILGASHSHSHSPRSTHHANNSNPSPQQFLYTQNQQLGNNYHHLNSGFNHSMPVNSSSHNNGGSGIVGIKGSDVSPYAYAHIVPKIAPPPPPLIEWYSESVPCNNGGHIFTNNLYSFQPNPLIHHQQQQQQSSSSSSHAASSSAAAAAPGSGGGGSQSHTPKHSASHHHRSDNIPIMNDGNASSTTRSTGSGSLIQIDGFQCRKNLIKDSHIVERFL